MDVSGKGGVAVMGVSLFIKGKDGYGRSLYFLVHGCNVGLCVFWEEGCFDSDLCVFGVWL